ncbi:hypothetical protein FR483_n652R [Paramecium bursaria Chlorella virus FR483]|uniref:Uncharacterized protein n652R n=1 Tax=Paramecium bursaria Chlorella virus FR483 TaxID=399781 RepID=A7J806_PBCVF|nr:hypothetical protein FR483_n652R [Paramecium bursaria Chlorella virus FR483]ABT15937.1 hypothetical protein FR483_n652R [Paramecium bursaria Chlorella virus FR483]
MKSKGFVALYCLGWPSATKMRSATNSRYCPISSEFMPIIRQGIASQMNSFSLATASSTIAFTCARDSLFSSFEYRSSPNCWCRPSSRLMNSLDRPRPGITPRFLSQKIAQKDPENSRPSTHTHATRRSANDLSCDKNFCAHAAFFPTAGIVSIASKREFRSASSSMSASSRREYISEWMDSLNIW